MMIETISFPKIISIPIDSLGCDTKVWGSFTKLDLVCCENPRRTYSRNH